MSRLTFLAVALIGFSAIFELPSARAKSCRDSYGHKSRDCINWCVRKMTEPQIEFLADGCDADSPNCFDIKNCEDRCLAKSHKDFEIDIDCDYDRRR